MYIRFRNNINKSVNRVHLLHSIKYNINTRYIILIQFKSNNSIPLRFVLFRRPILSVFDSNLVDLRITLTRELIESVYINLQYIILIRFKNNTNNRIISRLLPTYFNCSIYIYIYLTLAIESISRLPSMYVYRLLLLHYLFRS